MNRVVKWLSVFFWAAIIYYFLVTWRLQGEQVSEEIPEEEGYYKVPNYVHFLRLGRAEVTFVECVCLLAAIKNQKPGVLFVHADHPPRGPYWDVVKEAAGASLRLLRLDGPPEEVFGQPLNKRWRVYHGSDVLRLKILATYGGVFLDNDVYIVRDLGEFRRFEMSIGWLQGKALQNQVIVANKNAKFLRLWLETYKGNYNASLWYYNAGELPTKLLEQNPSLVHSAGRLFGNYGVVRKIFQMQWPDWRGYFALHLMARHQYLFHNLSKAAIFPVKFNHNNIHKYPITFREMVYDVYPY